MKCLSVACLLVTLFATLFSSQDAGANSLPGENPVIYRNSLHRNYVGARTSGTVAVPEVLPPIYGYVEKASFAFDDLLLSESVGPANFTQDNSAITSLKGGRMAAVWEDDRQGPTGLFLQLLDNNGNILGTNTALIVGGNFDLTSPCVSADTNGNFYVVWREEINGYLQAARFDSLANLITPIFFISDTTSPGFAGDFNATCLPDGRLIVAWEDHSAGTNISFQLFAPSGNPSTLVATANSDGLPVKHWSPAVAAAEGGDFALAWEDYRSGSADIYFRRFNSLGLPYASEFSLVDAAAIDSGRFLPSLVFSPVDGYVAAWVDIRSGQNIYLQQLTAGGILDGGNILLTSGSTDVPNWEIDLAVNSADHLLAAWTVYGGETSIVLQRFLSEIQFDGLPQTVSESSINPRRYPAITGNMSGNAAIAWTDLSAGSVDILGAVLASDGSAVKTAFMLNDDATGSPSIEPQAVSVSQFEWAVVFTDKRRDSGDIMLQRVYVGGDLLDANRMINADTPGGFQSQPAVASSEDFLLVSWTDERVGGFIGQNIFCRFSRPQYSLTEEMIVNDDAPTMAFHYNSACAITGTGISLIVWTDTRGGNRNIFGQLLDQDFQKTGPNFLIGPTAPTEIGEMAKVSADGNGNFIVCYLNQLNSNGPSVEVKQITSGGAVSDLFDFASDKSGIQIDGFDAGVNSNDEVILVWHGSGGGETKMFMTAFNYAGTVVWASTEVVDDVEAMPETADISVDNNGYVLISWIDHRTGSPTPFRQIFASDYSPLGSNLPAYSAPGRLMQQPAAAGNRGRGIFVWSDARENGFNIYASQEIFEPTDAADDNNLLPSRFDLGQNYPNPFNPSTVIQFSLGNTGHVRLEIFNLLGQKVRTLIDQNYPAGSYSVTWDGTTDDGRKVSSGIYLYRLESGDEIRTRKMTLMK